MHGTTRGLNAILTGNVARTALLVTEGHPDILVLREGGRTDIFNHHNAYPDPYIPRALTFEVTERIGSEGEVVRELDEDTVRALAQTLRDAQVEAIAVTLLWSFVNPVHELRVREILAEALPDIPITLSHELNPCLREYRRASAAAIDASLKPVMSDYIAALETRMRAEGFTGRLLMMTSSGGVLDAADVVAAPIHSLNSGPSMAPTAGRFFSDHDSSADTVIVADTGGTSYDVSVVRRGRIPWTRESWIGEPFRGHMTGFPSVDVRSVGAGGGSIAWVDGGGMLHVGPQSAGADPGPACYGRAGTSPTLTDACLVLGFLDPEYFLGGRAQLDVSAGHWAIQNSVAEPLGLTVEAAAAAIWELATEHMVGAIQGITSNRGIDPRAAVLVGGGGAAGFNTVAIGRRLGCEEVVIPTVGPALSAAGALLSELSRTFERTLRTSSDSFDYDGIRAVLSILIGHAHDFINGPGQGSMLSHIDLSFEARYPHQVWELEVPMTLHDIRDEADVESLVQAFHDHHRDVYKSADDDSPVEFESWHVRARCRISTPTFGDARVEEWPVRRRRIYLPNSDWTEVPVWRLEAIPVNQPRSGPAIIESDTTTIVIDGTESLRRTEIGSLWVTP
jgi:N-methylhydantoinase A